MHTGQDRLIWHDIPQPVAAQEYIVALSNYKGLQAGIDGNRLLETDGPGKNVVFRVSLGFFGGYFLNSFLFGLNLSVLVFSVIQWAFFIGFYSAVDKGLDYKKE